MRILEAKDLNAKNTVCPKNPQGQELVLKYTSLDMSRLKSHRLCKNLTIRFKNLLKDIDMLLSTYTSMRIIIITTFTYLETNNDISMTLTFTPVKQIENL